MSHRFVAMETAQTHRNVETCCVATGTKEVATLGVTATSALSVGLDPQTNGMGQIDHEVLLDSDVMIDVTVFDRFTLKLPIDFDAVVHWKVLSEDLFQFHLGLSSELSLGEIFDAMDIESRVGKFLNFLLERLDLSVRVSLQVGPHVQSLFLSSPVKVFYPIFGLISRPCPKVCLDLQLISMPKSEHMPGEQSDSLF